MNCLFQRIFACGFVLLSASSQTASLTSEPFTEARSVASEIYDIVIEGGRVVDPETALDAIRNVGITNDKITAVTAADIVGKHVIDARGKIVAPGFVDLHAHGQRILAGRVQAFDGVTTALELEAGLLPIAKYYEQAANEGRPIHYGASVNWAMARIVAMMGNEATGDLSDLFKALKDRHWQENLSTEAEFQQITKLVQQGLDDGGLGVGFLLGYAPGTGRKEYYRMNELAAENGVPTFTHARFLSAIEPRSSFEGFQEMVSVAAATGARMHICHLNSMSLRDIADIEPLIKRAQANGVPLTVEAYPYGAGATGIGAAMFRGEDWQARLGGIKKSDFELNGEPLTDTEFDRLQSEDPGTGIVVHILHPDNRNDDQLALDKSVLFEGGVIASDGGPWLSATGETYDQNRWPLPETAESHPRSAGTFARFLRIYVRERGVISLLDAIAKTSYLPAKILEDSIPQMATKGRIQEGSDADLVVFDLSRVSDRATFESPAQTSLGFEHVIIAGIPLISDGILDQSAMPGRPIRRAQK